MLTYQFNLKIHMLRGKDDMETEIVILSIHTNYEKVEDRGGGKEEKIFTY